jgi:2Fe-2S ferredoxin
MVKITFFDSSGAEHLVQSPTGYTLMEAALKNGVLGIEAVCGGACACGTCHIHIDPAWMTRAGAPSESEVAMFECIEGVTANSRLACQIEVSNALDGLVVQVVDASAA